MSYLKPGTICILVCGPRPNIGLIVEIIDHIGPYPLRTDVYRIRTVSGRVFPQLYNLEGFPIRTKSPVCITDRHKLRPLVDSKDESETHETDVEDVRSRERELTDCSL